MSAKHLDPRVKRTQAAFQQALLSLLQQKHFEQIRIKEIAETAGFSRHAFYSHFESKEALLFSYFDDVFKKIGRLFLADYQAQEAVALFDIIQRSFDVWREHAVMLEYVLQVGRQDQIIERFRKHFELILEIYLRSRQKQAPSQALRSYLISYVVGGWFSLIKQWTFEGMQHDSATMTQLLLDVSPVSLLIGDD